MQILQFGCKIGLLTESDIFRIDIFEGKIIRKIYRQIKENCYLRNRYNKEFYQMHGTHCIISGFKLSIWSGNFKNNELLLTDESFRINLPLFSTVVPASIFMFLSCRIFVVITTLSNRSCEFRSYFGLLAWAVDRWSLNR